MNLPLATRSRPSYENFKAQCPHCANWTTFNRASDLRTLELIAGQDVICQHPGCGGGFRITGDEINPLHEMLVFDVQELKTDKRYIQCVLSLAQAFEAFYASYLQHSLIERLVDTGAQRHYGSINELSAALSEKTQPWAAPLMRRAFLWTVLKHPGPAHIEEAKQIIDGLRKDGEPADEALLQVPVQGLGELLVQLKSRSTEIESLRNDVVHKHARRPTLDEVEKWFAIAGELLFPLGDRLGMTAWSE